MLGSGLSVIRGNNGMQFGGEALMALEIRWQEILFGDSASGERTARTGARI